MISKYKTIFFDAGGTLLYPHPSVGEIYQRVSARYGCLATSDQIQKSFVGAWKKQEGLSKLTGRVTEKVEREWWRNLVTEVFSSLGTLANFDDFFHELYDLFATPEAWRLYPEVHGVLDELKRRGQKLAIISNWDSRLFKLCDTLGISAYFDFILASAVFGASKPGPRIFEEALRRTGVNPSEAIHIGDSFEDDIKGAHAVGMHTILIDRHGHHEEVSNPPMWKIRELGELIKVESRE